MAATPIDDRTLRESQTISLVEETARVATRDRVTGRVRVSTHIETRDEVVRTALRSESVDVTRVPVNRQVDTAPAIRTEGDVTIVSVVEEVLVVEKRLMLREELHIRRTVATQTVEEPVQLRRERAVVERFGADGSAEPSI